MGKNILDLLNKIMSFKSITSNTDASKDLISFIQEYLSNSNLVIKKISSERYDNLLIYSKNRNDQKPFRILLNAHVDVVPAPDTMFEIKIQEGKAYGRGVYDMNGASSAMIELFKNESNQNTLPEDVGLMIVTDEEIGGFGGTKQVMQDHIADTNFFLGGEPTNLQILTAHKGILKVTISTKGKAAHGSTPWNGKNAIIQLSNMIHNFFEDNPQPTNEAWETTYSPNIITGGTAFNVVPEKAEITFDIRSVDTDSSETILEKLRKYFTDAEISVTFDEPGLNTSTLNPEIEKLSKIILKHTNQNSVIMKAHYATDARFYYQKGIPAIHLGPIGGNMHEEGEWLDIKSLSIYYLILQEFIKAA